MRRACALVGALGLLAVSRSVVARTRAHHHHHHHHHHKKIPPVETGTDSVLEVAPENLPPEGKADEPADEATSAEAESESVPPGGTPAAAEAAPESAAQPRTAIPGGAEAGSGPGPLPGTAGSATADSSLSASPAPPPPGAFTMPISGQLFADAYVPLRWPWDRSFVQLSTSAWLEVDPSWKQTVGAKIIGTADVIYRSSAGAGRYRPRLREGYVYARGTGWEVKAGQLLIPWGQSDAVNPTDFLTAKDFTFFNPDEEIRREGAPGASVTWTPAGGAAPVTFTVVVVGLPARSTLLVPPGLLPPSALYVDRHASAWERATTSSIDDGAAALAVAYAGTGWDASLIGYRGWSSLPELAYRGYDATTGVVLINPAYHRISAVGANASTSLGSWVLRAEGAYVMTENNDGQNPLIQPSHLQAVGGVERPLGESLRFGVQGIWRWNSHLSPAQNAPYTDVYSQMVNPLLAEANAILFGYQATNQLSATARVGYSDAVHLIDVDLFAIYNFHGRDSLIRFKASYGLTQSLKLSLGFDRYAGPVDSPFGAMRPFSAVFAEGKFMF